MSRDGASLEVILGVGGGVSAYKSCDLLRRLRDLGYGVNVIPTRNSLNFVGLATWEALSGRAVASDIWQQIQSIPHIKLARAADAIVIAPATADLIARLAQGRADDLLSAVTLTATCKKILVPAMHTEMLENPATAANLAILAERGFLIVPPESGALTSGDFGPGRYPSTSSILSCLQNDDVAVKPLNNQRVLISAGGTREAIDAVRFIGNSSSGKQGIALAQAAKARGAEVTLVIAGSSPNELGERGALDKLAGVEIVYVNTALEMQSALTQKFPECDLLFMSAAVADKRPANQVAGKLAKGELADIHLVDNPDIVAGLGQSKGKQYVIAFAAQSGGEILALAEAKMKAKRADLMYVNDVSRGAIFGSDATEGWILAPGQSPRQISALSKSELADELLDIYLASRPNI